MDHTLWPIGYSQSAVASGGPRCQPSPNSTVRHCVPIRLAMVLAAPLHLRHADRARLLRGSGSVQRAGVAIGALPHTSRLTPMHAAGVPIADPQRVFVEQLPTIERVISIIVRRHALNLADSEEFASWARAKIIDNDYAVFRKFAGRASLPTYLTVVLGNLFLDFRNSLWGKWRPSVPATRLGPVGVRLEELLYRDSHSLREAIEVLRSAGVQQSDAEIRQLARALPVRVRTNEVPLETLEGTPSEADDLSVGLLGSDDALVVLRAAFDELPPEDQVIMRMRYWDDSSIADISRALRVEQKPLYRRIENIEAMLRDSVVARGFDRERAREVLSSDVSW